MTLVAFHQEELIPGLIYICRIVRKTICDAKHWLLGQKKICSEVCTLLADFGSQLDSLDLFYLLDLYYLLLISGMEHAE